MNFQSRCLRTINKNKQFVQHIDQTNHAKNAKTKMMGILPNHAQMHRHAFPISMPHQHMKDACIKIWFLNEPENYTSVRDNIPNENETDALSYVEFQSHLDLKYGKNIPTMFLIPVLWFFFPAKPKPTAILDGQKGEQEEWK